MTTNTLDFVTDDFETVSNVEDTKKTSPKKPNKKSSRFANRNLVYLIFITLVIIFSSYWTHFILSSKQTSVQFKQTLLQQISTVEIEKSMLTQKLSEFNKESVDAKKLAAQKTVFSGYLELADWLYYLSELGESTGMRVEYQLFDANQDSVLRNMHIVPMEIRVFANSEESKISNFQNFMSFLQILTGDNKYKKFTAASIENQGQQSALLTMKLEVRKQEDNLSASNSR